MVHQDEQHNPIRVGLATYQVGLGVVLVGLLSTALWGRGLDSSSEGLAIAGLAIVAAIAERGRVRLTSQVAVSISLIPTVFAAVVFGPGAAALVGAASFAGEWPLLLDPATREEFGVPWARWRIYTLVRALCGALAGFAAFAASGMGHSAGATFLQTALAAGTAELLDVGFNGATGWVRGRRFLEPVTTLAPVAVVSVPLYTPLVGMLALAYRDLSPWTLLFFFVPALAAQRLFALYQSERDLSEGLAQMNQILEQANLSFASALVATLDARDRYTAGHSAAVAIYARDIAARMCLTDQEQRLAHLCGLVHDIGKIGLPAGLLEKPGALTLDERREMQRHSEIGERILINVETYAEIAAVVRHHHERMDGNGYPDGITGTEIPLLARIIAVADAYNAMTSDRPYRDAMPTRVARLRLAQAVESQFDTTVVAAFEAILAGASEEYRQAKGAEFRWLEEDSLDDATESDQLQRSETVYLVG